MDGGPPGNTWCRRLFGEISSEFRLEMVSFERPDWHYKRVQRSRQNARQKDSKACKWCKIPLERLPDPRKTSPGNFKEFQRSLVLRATSTKNLVCQGLKRAPSTVQIKKSKLILVTAFKVGIRFFFFSNSGFRYLGGREF